MAKRIRATIPPEIRQDEEENDMDPEVAAQFQQIQMAIQERDQAMAGMAQEHQQLQQTIQGKVIEQQMKAQDYAMKMAEMEQERAIKQMEFEMKQAELLAKQQEASLKLQMQAEKDVADAQGLAAMVETASAGAAGTQQAIIALVQATQQQGELLAALLQEMAKPKRLAVETDANGNIVGGVSQTLN
jgi:hypothetical protein